MIAWKKGDIQKLAYAPLLASAAAQAYKGCICICITNTSLSQCVAWLLLHESYGSYVKITSKYSAIIC